MNNVTSAYQEAVSSLINLESECKNSLPPEKLVGVNKILNDVQRRLSKLEPNRPRKLRLPHFKFRHSRPN